MNISYTDAEGVNTIMHCQYYNLMQVQFYSNRKHVQLEGFVAVDKEK